MIERMNQEIRRRTRAVFTFPDGNSALMLVFARLRHVAEKIDGVWEQKLTIHYNCVGAIFIPDTDSLPIPDVTVNTRRGVFVTYVPQNTTVQAQKSECS